MVRWIWIWICLKSPTTNDEGLQLSYYSLALSVNSGVPITLPYNTRFGASSNDARAMIGGFYHTYNAGARGRHLVLQAVRAGVLPTPQAHDPQGGRPRGTLSNQGGEAGSVSILLQ